MKLAKPEAIIFDIEGTITSINFVKDTLFGYVKENLEKHLNEKWNTDDLNDDIKLIIEDTIQLRNQSSINDIPLLTKENITEQQYKELIKRNVLWQMSNDLKMKGLKQLQGHIWKKGYANKEIKGHVFPDVPAKFEKWTKSQSIDLYIFSSGSVEAQKLLLSTTDHGDLTPLIKGHFDTQIGPKIEPKSYENILQSIKKQSKSIVFFTDILAEAEAATKVGIKTVIVMREGNVLLPDDIQTRFTIIHSLDEIEFE